MRSNCLIILILFLVACSRSEDRDYSVLKNYWSNNDRPSRAVASVAEPECRSDFFQKDLIVKEIKDLEAKFEKKEKVSGTWKHLSLNQLPTAQANFLLKYGKDLGDYNKNDYDFSTCSDVPCVINTIYESTDGLEGQVIYFWYLKMGNLLAVDNKVYEQISTSPGIYLNKVHPFKNFLFSRDELYGFWRLAQSLPPRYSLLTNLNEIQRIPKSSSIEDESAATCGLADNQGHIRLNDGCLTIGILENKGEGYFYQAVTHELSHELDYLTAMSIKPRIYYYSQAEEWKNEGGWFLREILDASTGAITIRQWDTNLAEDKFVSDYARTSPPEHFAETLSYIYDSAEYSKKTLPTTTYDLVQKKFFDHMEYDGKNLKSTFLKVADQYDISLFNSTEACLKNPGVIKLTSNDVVLGKFFSSVSAPEVKNCLVSRMKGISDSIVKDINLQQFYGCSYTKGKDSITFKNELFTVMSNKMNHHYAAYLSDKNYFSLFSQFYKQFESIREAQMAFMSCQGENDEELCYQNTLKKQIIELMPPELEFKETAIADLLAKYSAKYPLTIVHDETIKIYQQFILSSQNLINENAALVWAVCRQQSPDDKENPVGTPFSAKTQYVVSSLMNCINQAVNPEMENLVVNLNSDVLIKNEKEKRLLKNLALPLYLQQLNELLRNDVEAENLTIKSFQDSTRASLKEKLVADFSWIKSGNDKGQLALDCKKQLLTGIELPLYFHLKSEHFNSYVTDICAEVTASSELSTYLEKVYLSSWTAAEENLKQSLTTRATQSAKDCLGFYPKSTGLLESMNSKKRLGCFQDQWGYLELSALREFNETGIGSKNTFDQVELKQRYKIIAVQVKEQVKKLYLQ